MDIRVCPRCGIDDVSKSSYSDGYDSGFTYTCSNCNWSYGKSGVGITRSASGTHPKEFSRWCDDCETVFETKNEVDEHVCTVTALIDRDGPLTIQEAYDGLDEFQSERRVREQITDAFEAHEIGAAPKYTFKLTRDVEDAEEHVQALILDASRTLDEPMFGNVLKHIGAESNVIESFVRLQLDALMKTGNEIELAFESGLQITESGREQLRESPYIPSEK